MKIRLHTLVTNNGENIAVIGEPLGRTSRQDFTKNRKTNMERLKLAPSGATTKFVSGPRKVANDATPPTPKPLASE